MAKVSTQTTKVLHIALELNESEVYHLSNYMQNYVGPTKEPGPLKEVREALFNALNPPRAEVADD